MMYFTDDINSDFTQLINMFYRTALIFPTKIPENYFPFCMKRAKDHRLV